MLNQKNILRTCHLRSISSPLSCNMSASSGANEPNSAKLEDLRVACVGACLSRSACSSFSCIVARLDSLSDSSDSNTDSASLSQPKNLSCDRSKFCRELIAECSSLPLFMTQASNLR